MDVQCKNKKCNKINNELVQVVRVLGLFKTLTQIIYLLMVLATTDLNLLPSYGIKIQWYPRSDCDYLDKVSSRFIWMGSDDKGLHLVSWD